MTALNNFGDYQTDERMQAKLRAIPLPELRRKRVLDVGCDHGYWCKVAHDNGADFVLGLDRGRKVRGRGRVDLAERNSAVFSRLKTVHFEKIDIGRQWHEFGQFDVIFCFSVFHHIYQASGGDLESCFFWLWRHLDLDGELLWENPVDISDSVVRANVAPELHDGYTRKQLIMAADRYFRVEMIGPALHEPTREVWRLKPREIGEMSFSGTVHDGAKGATIAFDYKAGRRCSEIEVILGVRPFPGSLNVETNLPFTWHRGYYRAQILDVVDRSKGFESEWALRWARFYPLRLGTEEAYAFRFEGERYRQNFLEIIAKGRLRDNLRSNRVTINR